ARHERDADSVVFFTTLARAPLSSPLFPYTTLFRSKAGAPFLECLPLLLLLLPLPRATGAAGHGAQHSPHVDPAAADALHRAGDAPLRVGPARRATACDAARIPHLGDPR